MSIGWIETINPRWSAQHRGAEVIGEQMILMGTDFGHFHLINECVKILPILGTPHTINMF